jgi:hypothetical protein
MRKIARERDKGVALEDCVNVSLDIECLGLAPGCKVLSIGACVVGKLGLQFYRELGQGTLQQCGEADIDTLAWWRAQTGGPEFLERCAVSPTGMESVLVLLTDYLERVSTEGRQLRIWTQGQFDLPILAWHYKQEHMPVPWHYWEQVDLRSIRQMYPSVNPERSPELVNHHALHDAMYQADVIEEILNKHQGRS